MYVNTEIADKYQEFFNFMSQEHDLTLTISEMDEIVSEAQKLAKKLAIPLVSHRTISKDQFRIEPVYDGQGPAVETYKVVDVNGSIWVQGTRQECETYLYGG